MLGRHIRLAGVQFIENLLSEKLADTDGIFNPTLGALKAQATRKLNNPPNTASAVVPKIVTAPMSSTV